MIVITFKSAQSVPTYTYQEELKKFKESPEYTLIFDEDANQIARDINRDIENFKELPLLSRLARIFILTDSVVVTPATMPMLYDYIDWTCKEAGIDTPPIFISIEKRFFNAVAMKLFASTGAILIGQKMITETDDEELEAIIAHEIGHIKYNHSNKALAIFAPSLIVSGIAAYLLYNAAAPKYQFALPNALIQINVASFALSVAGVITSCIINKRFEKDADRFACELGKAEGFIASIKHFIEKDKKYDMEMDDVLVKLEDNKERLDTGDYNSLKYSFYIDKYLIKWFKWLYYKTPVGAHPSHEERLAAAQEYLITQNQKLQEEENFDEENNANIDTRFDCTDTLFDYKN